MFMSISPRISSMSLKRLAFAPPNSLFPTLHWSYENTTLLLPTDSPQHYRISFKWLYEMRRGDKKMGSDFVEEGAVWPHSVTLDFEYPRQ